MSDNQIGPISLGERIEVIDVLRGLAICGILIGNMQWFSGYGMMPPAMAEAAPLADRVTAFLVHFFVEGKFYSIFSFLFGFGFALQIARAEQRGDTNASLFKRRLFWLLVIGVLHAVFLWPGDILSVYAVTGFILILFRRKSDTSLLKWAAGLMIVPVVTYALLTAAFIAFAPRDVLAGFEAAQLDMWAQNVQTVSQGSYWQILAGFNPQYLAGRWIGLVVQMRFPKILAMFLLGYYAYRRGFFQDLASHRPFFRKVLIYGLALGLIANIAMAALAGNEAPFPPSIAAISGVIGYAFGVPAMALGIIALVSLASQNEPARRLLAVFAPVGRMALTNYLLQTVISVSLFYGYGLGWFGTFGAAKATLTALGIFVVQVILSTMWLRLFSYGPMEWIWRQLTYRKRISLRRGPATA
jgi:uncharacterized protein